VKPVPFQAAAGPVTVVLVGPSARVTGVPDTSRPPSTATRATRIFPGV
jgi:hypothetical protein